MNIDKQLIPAGMHCYGSKNGTYYPCPYWKRISDKGIDGLIFCEVLQKGDSSNLNEAEFNKLIDAYGSEDDVYEKYPYTLLWDQSKECGINDDIDEHLENSNGA